jgi:hypothetical protein
VRSWGERGGGGNGLEVTTGGERLHRAGGEGDGNVGRFGGRVSK